MNDTPPPASRYPTIAQGLLVEPTKAAMGFPTIPGIPATAPTGLINPVLDYDFGSLFNYTEASGIVTNVPPTVKQVIKTLVPAAEATSLDGTGGGGGWVRTGEMFRAYANDATAPADTVPVCHLYGKQLGFGESATRHPIPNAERNR